MADNILQKNHVYGVYKVMLCKKSKKSVSAAIVYVQK